MNMINLTISERIAALAILNDFKGNLETMANILEDIKQFSITDEEWIKAERKETALPNGGMQWNWDDEKGGEKEIKIQKTTEKYLKEIIKQKDQKKEITFKDKALISLNTKL